jgi:hypothetical protein
MIVFGAVVDVSALERVPTGFADDLRRDAIGRQPVCDQPVRPTISLHQWPQGGHGGFAIPSFGGNHFKHFVLMTEFSSDILGLSGNLHKDLVEVPLLRRATVPQNEPSLLDLNRDNGPKLFHQNRRPRGRYRCHAAPSRSSTLHDESRERSDIQVTPFSRTC